MGVGGNITKKDLVWSSPSKPLEMAWRLLLYHLLRVLTDIQLSELLQEVQVPRSRGSIAGRGVNSAPGLLRRRGSDINEILAQEEVNRHCKLSQDVPFLPKEDEIP